jgi:DNA-binding NarL/FixJ family response regulator
MTPAKILLVDDHQIMRDGLHLLLHDKPEFKIVGDAFDTEAAWLAAKELKPDLVILDLELPGIGGAALAHRLRQNLPEIKVVVLTGHAEPQIVKEVLRAGVHGYVLKMNASSELIAALRAVLAGQVYLCPEISTLVVREYRRQIDTSASSGSNLSTRELDVLKRIAEGQTTKEIAFALSVSTKTVETHRVHLLTKLGVKSVAELTKYAIREGLTTL